MRFEEHKPIFKQIGDYIIDQIITGHWKPGDRIPSVRELAAEVEVNPNTVARTFSMLSDQSIIYNQRGIGYFIENGARKRVIELKKNEFLKQELPSLLKKMDLLEIDINQINQYYEDFKNEKK